MDCSIDWLAIVRLIVLAGAGIIVARVARRHDTVLSNLLIPRYSRMSEE